MTSLESTRVLCVSDLRFGYPMRQRYEAMLDLGITVKGIDQAAILRRSLTAYFRRLLYWASRHGIGLWRIPDPGNINGQIIEAMKGGEWDILWLDRALCVERSTLLKVRKMQPRCLIVGFSHDDMARRHNQSRQLLQHLSCYDVFYTTKSYNVDELRRMGCHRCEFVDNAYDPSIHRPLDGSRLGREGGRFPVGFVGHWEKDRENLLRTFAEAGIKTYVWGGGWQRCTTRHPNLIVTSGDILGDEYAMTLSATEIGLCLLRKVNRDLQTTRSIEIPACGAFMLAERTDEHKALFEEGKEAEYFDTASEAVEKIRYFLSHPEERKKIAAAGRERCLRSGYSYQNRMRKILEECVNGKARDDA